MQAEKRNKYHFTHMNSLSQGGIKYFMLNSTVQDLIMLINVKMPTIVGILTFISIINTTSESFAAKN